MRGEYLRTLNSKPIHTNSIKLFEEENKKLKRKILQLQGEFKKLKKEVSRPEFQILLFENQSLKEEIDFCKRTKKNIFTYYENALKIEMCLNFEENVTENATFFEKLVSNMLSSSQVLLKRSLPKLKTLSKSERHQVMENFLNSSKKARYKSTENIVKTPVIELRQGTARNEEYTEDWIRIDIFDVQMEIEDFAKFHEWSVENGVYAMLLRLYVADIDKSSSFTIEDVTDCLKKICIQSKEKREVFYYLCHKLYTSTACTLISAYLPRVDVSVKDMDGKASSFCHTYHMERCAHNPRHSNYTYVCRLKRNRIPEYIAQNQTLPSLEELSVVPYAASMGINVDITLANIVAMTSILPNLEFVSK